MSSRTAATPPQLPDELTESMHRIASITGSASAPWPAVDQAITRQHRRRVALASATLAVVLAAGVGTASVLLAPASVKNAPASQSMATDDHLAPELKQAHYASAVGGSLASDQGFVDRARAHIAQDVSTREARAVSTSDVLVFFAGDLDGFRIVIAGYPPASTADSILTVAGFSGPQGAAATALAISAATQTNDIGRKQLGRPMPLLIEDPASQDHGVFFVIAPNTNRVELGTGRRFLPGGEVSTTWTGMQKQGGSTWVAAAGPTALRIAQYRADSEVGDLPGSEERMQFPLAALKEIAAPGTDGPGLRNAQLGLTDLGLSGSETPVLAGTTTSGGYTVTAAVLRSADNGYLGSVSTTTEYDSPGGKTRMITTTPVIFNGEFAGPDDAMAAIEFGDVLDHKDGKTPDLYVVIAPKGAVTVKLGADTAVVKNRVALLTIPADRFAETGAGSTMNVPITAVDASGNELATVNSQEPALVTSGS